ncbi:LamG-like jellyroll fold domain-containing protein [uncultured Nocardioides sp.]|uniref:LamG-like jellyroll fold domain-containing protein n=1 Tax=uncultured Nocardioides sp. TaxID=198441 RepID=UPI00261E221E|nr:LamG-like jellyroll fold domain-containing protein [uncultured Nocardioides sp.]
MSTRRRPARTRVAHRARRLSASAVAALTGALVALSMLSVVAPTPAAAAPDDGVLRVLLFYKSNFHASHVQARQAIRDLTEELGEEYAEEVDIQETDDPAVFNDENLATVDTLAFAQTGGVLFNDAQREALETYIRGGGGFMGVHYTSWSVGTSEHDVNPFFLELVGAMSEGHPENPAVRPGRVVNTDPSHPLTADLPAEITRSDEWYDWTANPAQDVRTLLEADESSYGMGRQGSTHPITWCQEIDAGRSWFTGMGHEGSAYSEPFMLDQMRDGLAYSSGLKPADCSAPDKSENGSWGGVQPWPLMAINASLTPEGTIQSFGSTATGCTDATPFDWTGDGCISQGGQFEYDVWDPSQERTLENLDEGLSPNATYTDLFCAMQVQQPHTGTTMTVGGDDGLGENAPNDAAIGVTSYSARQGLQDEAPMHYPRWYPTGTTMPNGDIVVQGGSLRGGPGGPGVKTPEIYTPDEGTGWRKLTGARSTAAYGDGGSDHPGQDENRWWYPRAFVAPGSGTLFNVTGTQMYELDPYANDGDGEITLRGTLPSAVANQGALGNPVGATSTAVTYAPGKILQVGGGWWANGGGPAGARAGLTVDITGGTENPVVAASEPMEHRRHWPTGTVMPDGRVIVTGGSADNNGNGDYVTNPEIWDPATGEWTTVDVPHEHARLYHSTALLVPDGRIMIAGGGAPGPRNYRDVEYYSPSYLPDGDEPAARPELSSVPGRIGYAGTFDVQSSTEVSRVTLVRNGSVTHGFNNDQGFQDLDFTQDSSGRVRITAPEDATYAVPGAYMLFVWDADGTPSVAEIVDIDPEVELDVRTPLVVDQFEYPRIPDAWRSANPPAVIDVGADSARMTPWTVDSPVQLVRGSATGQGGLGGTGYQLGLGADGSLDRALRGLRAGEEYRVALKYARDSRATGTAPATLELTVGDLTETLTATTANPSGDLAGGSYADFVGTFTASSRREVMSLAATGGGGVMVDDLVVAAAEPGLDDVGVRYAFEEGEGSTAANTGTDTSVGDATLTGGAGWSQDGVLGAALDLPGGAVANAVDLPDDLLAGASDFSTAFWVRPDTRTNWTGLFHLGTGLGGDGGFFQIQTSTQADGPTGLAATFKAPGQALQERIYADPAVDLELDAWNHVAFVREGSTGTLYLDGEPVASRDDLTLGLDDVGPTENNWLGRNGFPDDALDGRMDDVRAYDSALTADDVTALYAEGAALRTEVSISVDPASPSPFGEPLEITASVDAEGDAVAEGTAQLYVDGTPTGQPVEVADGSVTFAEQTLGRGDHELRVVFEGAEGFRDAEATTTHTVERPPPGEGTPIHYTFDEGQGRTAANTGTDTSVGAATLEGATGWTAQGQYGAGVDLPGGGAGTGNQVRLPNDVDAGLEEDFTVSIWTRPDALPNWVPLLQIGSSTDTFFLLQSSTQANGPTGFAATFKAPGNGAQERLTLGNGNDTPLNEWTHVVFTMSGSVGRLYFDGELVGEREDFTLGIDDVGVGGRTTANFIGGTSWPDPRYDGLVDDFRMYDYELTEDQVGDLFEGQPEPGNAAPVAVDDSFTTDEDVPLEVEAPGVLANDTDADGDALTAGGATQPDHGEVTLAEDGGFTYTPDAGWSGTDSFTYVANDGTDDSEPATVMITVTEDEEEPPGEEGPVAVADVYSTDQDTVLTIEAPGVLANDTAAEGTTLTATAVGRPRRGEVELAEDGSFVYTPPEGFSGTDTFVYVANDGTDDSNLTTVTIAVDEVPPAVTAVAGVAAPFTYGRPGTVVAAVAPRTATGRVEVLDGETVLGRGSVEDGRARVTLPAGSLRPGSYALTLRYLGDARHAASSSVVDVEVAKASPTVTVQLPAAIDRGDRATLRVRVAAPGSVAMTGQVRVLMQGKKALTRRLDDTGRLQMSLPRANRAGQVRVRVVHLADEVSQRAEATRTMRVRR